MTGQAKAELNVSLRPVVETDEEFLVEVYATTRAEELAMVSWTEEQEQAFIRFQYDAQKEHYAKKYPNANHDLILSNGRQVGRLYVARLDEEIRIVDITVLPAERNNGIGTYLLKQLLEEATAKKMMTRIYVEEFNPSVQLFKRLGFNVSEQQGFHLLFQWTPPFNS